MSEVHGFILAVGVSLAISSMVFGVMLRRSRPRPFATVPAASPNPNEFWGDRTPG